MNQGMKTITLKTNFRGNSNFAAGMSVFIKKTFMSLVNVTGIFQVCADSLEKKNDRLESSRTRRCNLPNLDPFDESIMGVMFKPPHLSCPGQRHLTYYQNGMLSINLQSVSKANWHVVKAKPNEGSNNPKQPSSPYQRRHDSCRHYHNWW